MTTQALAARSLGRLMSEISERCLAAGWMMHLEYDLWRLVLAGGGSHGMYSLSAEDAAELRWLSDLAGGWVAWDDDADDAALVPLADWVTRYAAHEATRLGQETRRWATT